MTDYSPEYNKEQLTEMITGKLQRNFGCTVETANNNHMFKACALVLRDIMSRHRMETNNQVWEKQQRQVHYLSLEFLMGRSLEKNAYNLGLLGTLKEALEGMGFSASDLFTFAVRSKIYITSFLIYANRTLDPGLCTGFQRTPYMDLLPDCFRKAPFYNKRLAMELTPEPEEAVRAIHSVTYYRLSE